MLHVYERDADDDSFARRFISWDRACPDAEAARIVTEIVSATTDASGKVLHLNDDAMQGAIRWMADASTPSVAERARILRDALSSADEAARTAFITSLEAR